MFSGPISQLKPTMIAYFCWWNSSYLTVLEVASPSAELLWSVACQWLVIFGMELIMIYPMKMFGWSSKNCPNSQCGRAIIDVFDTLVATILTCRMYGLWKISACKNSECQLASGKSRGGKRPIYLDDCPSHGVTLWARVGRRWPQSYGCFMRTTDWFEGKSTGNKGEVLQLLPSTNSRNETSW